MKTNFYILVLIVSAFLSCDRIEAPYILTTGVIEGAYSGPDFPALGSVEQNILLEKFTGHGCVNCPAAAEEIEGLISTYGERIIPVSIYAGSFADPSFFTFIPEDFRTDYGDLLNTSFGISLYPTVLVNRSDYPNSTMIPAGFDALKLREAVSAQLAKEPKIAIQLMTDHDDSYERQIAYVNVHELSSELPSKLFIQILILENNLIAPQIDHDGLNNEYQHNHVLRYSATSNWGYDISNKFSNGQCKLMIAIPDEEILNFNKENLQFVAIVYDADNLNTTDVDELEILQVELLDLK